MFQKRLKQTSSLTFFTNLADFSACFVLTSSLHLFSFSRMSLAVLSLTATCCLLPSELAPAKLMNGYMVLANGGSQPRSSPSLSSRTFSRPAGDFMVNMDSEAGVRKMDTVVKLDAVSLIVVCWCTVEQCLLISIVNCVCLYVEDVEVKHCFASASGNMLLMPVWSSVCINPCVVLCDTPCHRRLTL